MKHLAIFLFSSLFLFSFGHIGSTAVMGILKWHFFGTKFCFQDVFFLEESLGYHDCFSRTSLMVLCEGPLMGHFLVLMLIIHQ